MVSARLATYPTNLLHHSHKIAKPETRSALPLALLKCIKEPFLAAIIPRLFLIVFRYSQPILIKRSIRFVIEYRTSAVSDYGDWLIISAVVVYLGLAVGS
jgi:hypothetical protein